MSTGPHLAWNVKATFRSYVEGAGGVIEVTEPARQLPETFVFAYVGGEPGIHRFGGAVRFMAHVGAMNLLVQDPWIHVDEASMRLSVAGTEATRTAGGRLILAEVSGIQPDDGDGILDVPTFLSTEGAVAFDFRYPAGTDLAPITFSVPAHAY